MATENKIKKYVELKKSSILRGDVDLIKIYNYLEKKDSDQNPISTFLNEKRLLAKEENLSYRVISHWEKLGLISSDRPAGKGWRKFSPMELLWLKIVKELRLFGMGIEIINKVKNNLSPMPLFLSELPILEFYVVASLMGNKCQLLVFANGEVEPVTLSQFETAIQFGTIENCIQIDLNRLVESIFPNAIKEPEIKMRHELRDEEMDIMLLLRTSNYKEIKIKRSNGKINVIEATEDLKDTNQKIVDLIKSADYQNIEIVTANGKVVSLKRTIKTKTKK